HHRTPRHHHHALRPATARGTDGARAAHHHTFGLLHRHGRGTAPHPTPGLPVRDHPRTRTRNLTPHRRVRRDRPTTLRTRQHPRTGALHALPHGTAHRPGAKPCAQIPRLRPGDRPLRGGGRRSLGDRIDDEPRGGRERAQGGRGRGHP